MKIEEEQELEEVDAEERAPKSSSERKDDKESSVEMLAGEELLKALGDNMPFYVTEEQLMEEEKKLSAHLASAFVKRQKFRGSDVRLDLGSLYSFPRGGGSTSTRFTMPPWAGLGNPCSTCSSVIGYGLFRYIQNAESPNQAHSPCACLLGLSHPRLSALAPAPASWLSVIDSS